MRRALLTLSIGALAGCFGSHGPGADAELSVPACVASAPRLIVPPGPGCASLELTVQDLPASPLPRCVFGESADEMAVQAVYVANLGDGSAHVEVQQLSEDCFSGAATRCGGASQSDAAGCACSGVSYDAFQLIGRSEMPSSPFEIAPPGGTIFVGRDRVRYRVVACRRPTSSDPFPLDCDPSQESGDVDPTLCDGYRGFVAEGVDESGREQSICYCAPECVTSADCPRTSPGEVAPFCDSSGICRLPCDEGGLCPTGTTCVRIPRLETRFDRPVCATTAP